MKILSIFAILLIFKGGFGQGVSSKEFRLVGEYQNQQVVENDDIRISPYSLDPAKELAILGSGSALLAASLIIKNNMEPLTEQEVALLDPADVPAFDRETITIKRAMPAGDFLLFSSVFLPLTFIVDGETRKDMGTLAILAAEVFVVQWGFNYMTKVLAKRVRPYCYDEYTPLSEKTTVNAKLSFYSGHTSTTAAMSFFVAKVFSDYLSNPDTKFLIWTSAALYPFVTGMLRVDSGSHFLTDIIVGYAAGALIGYFIPVLHKSKPKDNLSIRPEFSTHSVALRLNFSF